MARKLVMKTFTSRFNTKGVEDQYRTVGPAGADTVGVYSGDVRGLPAGIYQVSLGNDNQTKLSGMPIGCYKWGMLFIFLSPWSGKVWMYFPDNLYDSYMYVMSKWNEEFGVATWKKIAVSAVSGGVIADILDFSYQTQERMVA